MSWDRDKIIALAPDSASIAAAQKLTNPAKWPLLQHDNRAIWGHCQGSGKNPYLIRVDLEGPAFKCSCPSRKFPCKHGLAIFLLYAEQTGCFDAAGQAPDWVTEWLDGRDNRTQIQKEKQQNTKPVDEKARRKRQQQRQDKVGQGIGELSQWLQDCVRVGIAELNGKPYRYWEDLAARQIDAQAPGLATTLRRLGGLASSGADAMSALTAEFGKLHLLLQSFQHIEQLETDLQADIRNLIGWSQTQEELLQQPPSQDLWLVLGNLQSIDDKLIMQTTWLYGLNSERHAKIIQYAHTTQRAGLALGWSAGDVLEAAVHFYPSTTPLRAIVGESKPFSGSADKQPRFVKPAEMVADYRQKLCSNPWLNACPVLLTPVTIALREKNIWLFDNDDEIATEAGLALPVDIKKTDLWRLMALGGGRPVNLFAEWDGVQVSPLGMWVDGEYWPLTHREELYDR